MPLHPYKAHLPCGMFQMCSEHINRINSSYSFSTQQLRVLLHVVLQLHIVVRDDKSCLFLQLSELLMARGTKLILL